MRILLKKILGILSNWAVKKHHISFIIITGNIGTSLAKEGIYTVISQKFIARRNLRDLWWDLSIPLTILGYKDKRYSLIEWIKIIFKSIFVLIFEQSSPHYIIISVDSNDENTIDYWNHIINPDYFVIVNEKSKSKFTDFYLDHIDKNTSVIFNKTQIEDKRIVSGTTYGKDKDFTVNLRNKEENVEISYKDKKLEIPKYYLPPFAANVVAAILALSLKLGFSFDDTWDGLIKFDLRNKILKKVSQKISEA